MKRLAISWLVAVLVATIGGAWWSGAGSRAQDGDASEAEGLLTQVAEAQRDEDALLADLAAALADERAAASATAAAAEATVAALSTAAAAAEATGVAQATEVAALQTQIADLEAAMPAFATQVAGTTVGLNEAAPAGAWEFTVTGVETRETLGEETAGAEPARPRGVFLLVTLDVVNTGTADQTYDPTWFRVTDDQGRGWGFDFAATDGLALAGSGARQYAAIPPGLPTEAVVVFDVPPDATGLALGRAEELAATSEPRPTPFTIRLED